MKFWMIAPLVLGMGCGGGIDGTWKGDFQCDDDPLGIPFAVSMTLKKGKALIYEGSASFVGSLEPGGVDEIATEQTFEFDATMTQTKPSGDQKLIVKFDCTAYTLTSPGVSEEGCQGNEGDFFSLAYLWTWDGADDISIDPSTDEADAAGCAGGLKRKKAKK